MDADSTSSTSDAASEPRNAGAASSSSAAVERWTIGRLLRWTTDYLREHGADSPRLDAEVLLAHAMACERIALYTRFEEVATDAVRGRFRELVKRRAAHTPVAYLVGHKEFFSIDFEVSPAVLIPRPDTEFVVTGLLDAVKRRALASCSGLASASVVPSSVSGTQGRTDVDSEAVDAERVADARPDGGLEEVPEESEGKPSGSSKVAITGANLQILDIGTGSGILAICAAKHLVDARMTAVDISPDALDVARRNAEKLGVSDRITFLESDLFSAIPAGQTFDFIVSNPPYVTQSEWQTLSPDVRDQEPHLALVAGEDGMQVYDRLLPQLVKRLVPGGVCLLETSPMLCETLEKRIAAIDGLVCLSTIYDLGRHPRVVVIQRDVLASP